MLTGLVGSLGLSLYLFSSFSQGEPESLPGKSQKVVDVEENDNAF